MKSTAILVIFGVLHTIEAKKIAYFTHVECPAPHSEAVYDFHCSLTKDTHGLPLLNLGFKLKDDTNDVTMHIKVTGNQKNKSEETFLVFDLNLCDALGAAHDHFFLKMIFDELNKVSNLPRDCPLKKNVAYGITRYSINSSSLPDYLQEMRWSALTYFNVSGVKATTFNAYGKLSEKVDVTI